MALAAGAEEAPARRDLIATERPRYSQGAEEVLIRDFFQDRREGFFLDVGCAWPIKVSTTYYLEKHLGWRGIGIDALPEYAEGWARERPRSKFFAFLVSDETLESATFYRSPVKGISSADEEFASGRVFAPGSAGLKTRKLEVPSVTLNDLLGREGVESIDLLSMDIEGHEPEALAGFDIARFAPELVVIEAGANRAELLAWFEQHGYERIDRYLEHDEVNWYFRPRASGPAGLR